MRFHICGVVEDDVAGEWENAAGGGGDERLDEEWGFVLPEVDVDARDLGWGHFEGAGRAILGSWILGHYFAETMRCGHRDG